MRVTVIVPQALRADCDGASRIELPFDGAARASLRGVLDELARRYPRLDRRIRDERGEVRRYVNIFVGASECRALAGLDTPVTEGDEIRILPSVAGG